GLVVAGHDGVVEVGERLPEGGPLGQDGPPAQPGLEPLEADLLEQAAVVGHREAPLGVVVGGHLAPVARPGAAGEGGRVVDAHLAMLLRMGSWGITGSMVAAS